MTSRYGGALRLLRTGERVYAAIAFCALLAVSRAHGATLVVSDFAEMTLEQLSNIIVTSVSRQEQPIGSAAASIYVINADDIRRSGARTIPEVLRLAPNLHVARADANQYAISARGFNNTLANRLLVLIDGRIVYSPLFSGVFWEVQNVMLEDVERIEVISGPGATLWGANAVSGVINIITRPARDTQGPLAQVGVGNRERDSNLRYGGPLSGGGHYRVYGKYFDRDNSERANRTPIIDDAHGMQAGFRADWGNATRGFTVQGDAYRTDIAQLPGGSRDLGGANLLARFSEQRADGSSRQALAYYDRVERDQPGSIREELDILHAEFQQGRTLMKNHRLLWGAGYRYVHDKIDNLSPAALAFIPATRDLHWYNAFVQDEWWLRPDLALTLGIKAEHNDYTGFEWLPSARIAWAITPQRLLWGALSRAVRAPSRIDRELFSPGTPPFLLAGGPQFRSEISNVLELGYRAQPTHAVSYSITAFHHDHQRLRSLEMRPGAAFENRMEGSTSGVEAWGTYRPVSNWRLHLGWVEMRQKLRAEAGSTSTVTSAGLGNDPHRWVTLRSALDITPRHELDIMVRYVGALPNPQVPSYTAVDTRLGWNVSKELQLSLILQNLFDPGHAEFGTAANRAEYRRGIFLNVLWRP